MTLRIRLSRGGAKKRPYYRIVVADSRFPRDGRFIERVGTYNPLLAKDNDQRVTLKQERIKYWLGVGARPSDRVARFLGQVDMFEPTKHNNPIKGQPSKKTLERITAKEEAVKAAASAAKVAAEAPPPPEPAPAEEAASEESQADAPAAEPDSEAEAAPEAAAEPEPEPQAEPAPESNDDATAEDAAKKDA